MLENQICPRCGTSDRLKDGRCKECTRASNNRWKANNRERHRQGSAEWAKRNPDKVRAFGRRYANAHKEQMAKNKSEWRKKNPDRHCAHNHKRRAMIAGNGGSYTTDEWNALCNQYENRCLSCGAQDVKLTVDHVIPIIKGGHNSIDNIQPLCTSCNSKKGAQIIDYRIGEQYNAFIG